MLTKETIIVHDANQGASYQDFSVIHINRSVSFVTEIYRRHGRVYCIMQRVSTMTKREKTDRKHRQHNASDPHGHWGLVKMHHGRCRLYIAHIGKSDLI